MWAGKLCLRQSRSAKSCKSTISFSPDCLTALSIDSANRLQNKKQHRAVSGWQSAVTQSMDMWGAWMCGEYVSSNKPLYWLPFLLSIYLKVAWVRNRLSVCLYVIMQRKNYQNNHKYLPFLCCQVGKHCCWGPHNPHKSPVKKTRGENLIFSKEPIPYSKNATELLLPVYIQNITTYIRNVPRREFPCSEMG